MAVADFILCRHADRTPKQKVRVSTSRSSCNRTQCTRSMPQVKVKTTNKDLLSLFKRADKEVKLKGKAELSKSARRPC